MSHDRESSLSTNRLAGSTSPYLRQHANNPVDWHEWGPEALGRARAEDKPILLSVGYSACHWCHVMAHESFDDPDIAAQMNASFINIKVDREERPDVDALYQRVVQLMGEGGGWPLTVFLLPDQRPFYGGTYFPPKEMHGRPGFPQVLTALAELYRDDRAKAERNAGSFVDGFAEIAKGVEQEAEHATGDPLVDDPAALRVAAKRLLSKVDEQFGGFGRAPKFPNPTALEIFAALARDEGAASDAAGAALRKVLGHMHAGGIYDHLRGGFARYSTDRVWLVPHFEKMLYDNAQLLPLYAEAAVRWPEHGFADVVAETVEYLKSDMRTDDGTFFAATDADSEGVEGKYFCWTPAQLSDVLGDEALASLVAAVYDVTDDGNFEHGWSILHLPRPASEHAAELGLSVEALNAKLAAARAILLAHRYTRVPPHRDDKIITSWNALLASGLLRAANAAESWGDARLAATCSAMATGCLDFLLEHHVDAGGRVWRAGFEGRVHTRGFVEDVAFLGRACLDAHERDLAPRWLDAAARLAQHACAHYLRDEGDGFALAAGDTDALIERTEAQHDGPIPSGLGVMLEVLARLHAAERAPEQAEAIITRLLDRFRGALVQPFGYASLLTAAMHRRPDAVHVTVRGPSPDHAGVRELAANVRRRALLLPAAVSLAFVRAGEASAIVCRNRVCTAPLNAVGELDDALAGV